MKRLLALLFILHPSSLILAGDPDFDSYWHDGKAELDGYRLSVSRYGQPRIGQAVLIYVTEPFSERQHVKVDDPNKNPSDVVDVLKLNLIRDFQTGIYDYNTMVSVFVRSADFSPVKTTFSSAEWCGHVYDELQFYPKKIEEQRFSYFEGESGSHYVNMQKDAITEDGLFILLRGLRGDFLAVGERKSVPFLPSVYQSRLAHKPLAWTTAEIERLTGSETIEVPAGKFETTVYTVKIADGREGKFYIEKAYSHRLVRWELLPDISAELTGSVRLQYWKLHDNGHESYLIDLGVQPTVVDSSAGGR